MTRDHIPPRMMRRPQDERGFPIPYSQFVTDDGVPDFRVLDVHKVRICLTQRRCGLCGDIMGRHIYFVGGPLCVANGIFHDPPMHRECAQFALAACPHLNRTKGKYNTAKPHPSGPGIVTKEAELVSDEKAEHFALMHGTKYTFGRGPDGMTYIQATLPWLDVELWRDGKPMKQEAPA